MTTNPLALPTPPTGIRVFSGFRRAGLDREQFWQELGHSFMPGTPLMQAPLGLSAYLPAVLDPEPDQGHPDEIAIIVYASREVYDAKRDSSLSRRMYTHSHAAVFDMDRARAQFAGPLSAPTVLDRNGVTSHAWCVTDASVDWQDGATRILFLEPVGPSATFHDDVIEASGRSSASLADAGCDQVIGLCTAAYAALWVHTVAPMHAPTPSLGLVPASARVVHELTCERAYVRGDDEAGVTVTRASAFCFVFPRQLSYFVAADANHQNT